jgi:hypothetical protein
MASFCGQCGFPQGTSSSFCPNCGGRLQGQASRPAPVQQVYSSTPAAPAAPPKGSSGLKILMVVLVVFAVGAVAVVGGLYYVAHKVKQTVVEKAATYGVDLSSSPSSDSSAAPHQVPRACDLLSQQEVAQLLGEPIERKEDQGAAACNYYGPPGLSAQLARQQADGTFRRAQEPGSTVSGTEVANSVDQLVNNLGAQAGPAGSGGEMPLLMLIVGNDGKAQMNALSASRAIFGGIVGAGGPRGMSMGADIPGLGDRAMRVPKLGLNVLQGEMFVRIIAGPVPDADAKTVEIARSVLPRL